MMSEMTTTPHTHTTYDEPTRQAATRGMLAWAATQSRKELGHSQIATALGLSRTSVYNWHKGMLISEEHFALLSEHFELHSTYTVQEWATWWRDYQELIRRP